MKISNKILNELKDEFEIETGIRLDFRTHVFLENQYGGGPTFSYSFAEKIVPFVYVYLTTFLEENKDDYPEFGGWVYNTGMSIEELRTTPLKNFIEDKISDILAYKK